MESVDLGNTPPIIIREPIIPDTAVKPQAAETTAQENIPQTVVPQETAVVPPAEILSETLLSYGFKNTDENKAMLKLMLENGIPLTKENVLKMNQAVKLTQSFEKALFMLQNNMRMTQANAAQLEGFVNGQTKITEQISNLLAAVEQLENTALAAELKQILSGTGMMTEQSETQPTAQGTVQTAQETPQAQQTTVAVSSEPTETAQAAQPPTPQNAQQPAQTQPAVSAQQNPPPEQPQQSQTIQQTQAAQPPTPQNAQPAQNPPEVPNKSSETKPPTEKIIQSETEKPRIINAQQKNISPSAKITPESPQDTQAAKTPAPIIPQKLLFTLKDSTPQTIEKYINNLREVLNQVIQTGQKSPGAARVLQEARTLESHIDFTSQIKNQFFAQLPIFYDDRQTLTHLHVYKDARKKKTSADDSSTALIALETASMGHFETYVRKNSNAIHCQFRLESDEIVKKVRNNIHRLNDLLREKGYSLDSFSFLPPGEPYTILNNPTETPTLSIGEEMPYFDKKV